MGYKWGVLTVALVLQAIGATQLRCPNIPNCICGYTPAIQLNCNIEGRRVEISLLPDTYININCVNTTTLDYNKLPKCANLNDTFKSVTFKNCPLPSSSFNKVLEHIGVSKTLALIFQNDKNLSGYFESKHFTGLQNLTKLLISVKGLTHLPDNLFKEVDKLQWLNIRSNRLNLSQELFKPLGRLETLEISHNHMSNVSSNLFSHLSLLRKLSLWQSNASLSKDLFTGANVLEELDLSSNGLDELPESLFRPLKKLKRLTLFSNKFSSLPKKLFLNNDELETVIMLNNDVELRKLPESLFGNLPNMKQVYLQRCGLEDVPYNLFANSCRITTISLAYNNIRKLPEPIFNDQINLFELDLSSNQLENLGPKLFSSLVRLEKLNLSYNNLVEISGSIFSPLLSLRYFNIEHNKLQVITSHLFVKNRQKMSISMAYNQLNLEDQEDKLGNITWSFRRPSPFEFVTNLRLLNLSHNSFKHTFKDWWENGHDVIDISHNHLRYLRSDLEPETFVFNPIREAYISNNPLQCSCINYEFIGFLREELHTKIPDFSDSRFGCTCPWWTKGSCIFRQKVAKCLLITICTLSILVFVRFYLSPLVTERASRLFKKLMYKYKNKKAHTKQCRVIIEYAENDEEFVFNEILPVLKQHFGLQQSASQINNSTKKQIDLTMLNPVKDKNMTFVIFSQNYLISHYSHVNIKKILGEMMEAKNTIYIFLDIGTDNSIFTFLKDHRDTRTMIVWNETYLWKRTSDLLLGHHHQVVLNKIRILNDVANREVTNNSLQSKGGAIIYALNTSNQWEV